MGAQHFKFHLVPAGARVTLDVNGDTQGGSLVGHEIPSEVLLRLRTLLPNPSHWGAAEEFNSVSEWGSDIRIFREKDGCIRSIGIRYAPVVDPIDLLRAFIQIAKDAGCDIVIDSSAEVLASEFDVVHAALLKHRAYRFIADPKSAIIEAAKEAIQLSTDNSGELTLPSVSD